MLKSIAWWKLTLKVKERDGYRCVLCEDKRYLSVHHTEYHGDYPEDTPPEKLRTVCQTCHDILHYFWKYTREFPIEIEYKIIDKIIKSGIIKLDRCEISFNYPITDFNLIEY